MNVEYLVLEILKKEALLCAIPIFSKSLNFDIKIISILIILFYQHENTEAKVSLFYSDILFFLDTILKERIGVSTGSYKVCILVQCLSDSKKV